jgi:hypothetical protein
MLKNNPQFYTASALKWQISLEKQIILPSESTDRRNDRLLSSVTMTSDVGLGRLYPILFLALTRKKKGLWAARFLAQNDEVYNNIQIHV